MFYQNITTYAEDIFPHRLSGALLHNFSKFNDVTLVSYPIFGRVFCFVCGAKWWLLHGLWGSDFKFIFFYYRTVLRRYTMPHKRDMKPLSGTWSIMAHISTHRQRYVMAYIVSRNELSRTSRHKLLPAVFACGPVSEKSIVGVSYIYQAKICVFPVTFLKH